MTDPLLHLVLFRSRQLSRNNRYHQGMLINRHFYFYFYIPVSMNRREIVSQWGIWRSWMRGRMAFSIFFLLVWGLGWYDVVFPISSNIICGT